jgi:hypothetical protein
MLLDPLDPSLQLEEQIPSGTANPIAAAIMHRGVLPIDPAASGFHAGGPAMPGMRSFGTTPPPLPPSTKTPPRISERAETALEQPAGFEQHMIGQRLPSEPNLAAHPQPRLVDIAAMRATPPAPTKKGVEAKPFLERATELFKNYPGTPPPWHNLPPEQQLARQVEQMKNNLLWLYDKYPAAYRDRAMHWYDGGNKLAMEDAARYGLSPRATAGVYAALSPQKDWFENVAMAQRVLGTVMDPQIRAMPMSPQMQFQFAKFSDRPDWARLYNDIAGKSYDQLEALPLSAGAKAQLKALWVRLYDDAHRSRAYNVVTPEGQLGDFKRNDDGTPAKLRWGTNDFIANAIRMIETNGAEAETLAGAMHKVRNFYNNLLAPNSPRGDVTIDTHAVAAAQLRALAGHDAEVAHNLATNPPEGVAYAPASAVTGIKGTYGIYADAYRQAAAERGILPRQMQSVTWEAIRGLFSTRFKQSEANKKRIDDLWRAYANGQATIEQTRDAVWRAAGGINTPDWAVPSAGNPPALQDPADTAELFELRVYGPGAGYPFLGGGAGAAAGAAPADTAALGEGAAAAHGAGAQ